MQKTTIIYSNGMFQEPTVFEFPLPPGFYFRNNQEGVLDYIYRQCNHVDGTEWIACRRDLRSMCIGDMAKVGSTLWVCQGAGWLKIL